MAIAAVARYDGAAVFDEVEAVVRPAPSSERIRIKKAIAKAELTASRPVPIRLLSRIWW